MFRIILSIRFIMLIASFGAVLGAMLLLWEGSAEVLYAAASLLDGEDRKVVIAAIMHGTDAFLFAIVLVIFAYAVAFGFVFDRTLPGWEPLPDWMRINSVSELKNTLVEVILLYLLVDFATDLPQIQSLSWFILVKPLSILAIAVAFGAFAALHPVSKHDNETRRGDGDTR